MNIRGFAAATILVALDGCGSTRLSNELKPYVGGDIHALMAQLGNPTGQREATGERIYVWTTDRDGVLAANPFTTSPGGEVSYAGSATPGGVIPVQFECTIEVTVDARNLVEHYQFEGSNAGCAPYRRKLSR